MKNAIHKLVVSYKGGAFKGWQLQGKLPTVQLELERAIERCWGRKIRIHGSGRTDTGVHALGQVCHFVGEKKLKPAVVVRALNDHLPPTVRVLRCRMMSENFHSRFSAKGKEYLYRIVNAEICSPFEIGRAWYVPRRLDVDKMRRAAKYLIGKHDFASFTSNPGYKRESTVRTIRHIRIQRAGDMITFRFRGDGFLYRMVRNLIGALVKVGTGRLQPVDIKKILNQKSRQAAPNTAPACGLYLMKVFY